MVHEIKRELGENSTQEYINHINLLKILKQDFQHDKSNFKERLLGVEFSLFIENIFAIESKDNNKNPELTTPADLVKNVIEKKILIEKLQDKINQRLEALNQLLVNHSMRQTTQSINPPPLNIVKNSINLINPTFLSKPNEQNFEWTKALFIPSSLKGKKTISKFKGTINTQRNSLDRISDNLAEKRRGSNTKRNQIDKIAPIVKPIVKKNARNNTKIRKSVDAVFSHKQHFANDFEIEDDTPTKVKLYYNTKNTLNLAVQTSKEASELTPNTSRNKYGETLSITKKKRPPQAKSDSLNFICVNLN